MSLDFSRELLLTTQMTRPELLQEVAVMLFQKEKLTLAQASKLAEIPQMDFQLLLASRGVRPHYDVEEFEEDLATLKRLGRL